MAEVRQTGYKTCRKRFGSGAQQFRADCRVKEAEPVSFEPLWALGLMSGTSLDGVDAALVRTDGEAVHETGPALTVGYDEGLRGRLREVLGTDEPQSAIAELAREITLVHAESIKCLLEDNNITPCNISIIGFHGHTILHRPGEGRTRQIGDGGLLAELSGIDVVDDFRSADVAAGGEGAPLAALYHAALSRGLERPLAVLNIGGVANVTWIGAGDDLLAFDTGPGNALLNDWILEHTGRPYDRDGKLARQGRVDDRILAELLAHPFFAREPPKSLDRNEFDVSLLSGMSPADGAATLTAFTAHAVGRAAARFPAPGRRWLVAGGGRRNPALMALLKRVLGFSVEPVEAAGWDGDALEAQAFGFLAVRALRGLPLSLPETTGAGRPVSGGTLHRRPG